MSDEGGDESPPRPKRKIKRVMIVSSSSGSDSEGSITIIRTRRKKSRVISEDETSDSSGSSVLCGVRRRRTVPKLRDSDADSDSAGRASDRSMIAQPSTSKLISGFSSDSSEGNSEKCSICLLRFTNQEIGTPISCEHIFCLDCITEWSKNVNTCPVDRITFESIVVRACMGGRVLRTEPVKVVERRPSIEILLTMCEICGRPDNEDTMLLCDGCDLGYHMQCLTPPLSEVPATEQWFCPHCAMFDVMDFIDLPELRDLFSESSDINMPLGPRPSPLRVPRNVRRSARRSTFNQPSTSRNQSGNSLSLEEMPTTSRRTRTTNRSKTSQLAQKRKKTSKRRSKKVIIEYEVEENGKFPVTRRMTRTVRKRKSRRRQPRTVARRTHVQASVRARLASLRGDIATSAIQPVRDVVPTLSLYGNHNDLDYFSDDQVDVSEGASTAVAMRPTSSILDAYRLARRKMISIPSPPHASSAPDILSNILESQTLLHSKHSVVSVTVDGNVNIKLQKIKSVQPKSQQRDIPNEKIDLSINEDCAKKVPSYPGQSRGGGGWGGGYRGSYHREHGSNNFSRGNYGGAYQSRQPANNVFNNNYQNNNMRRESEPEFFDNFPRRPNSFPPNDDSYFDRQRRNSQNDLNRPPNYLNTARHNEQPNQGRFNTGPSWQPYGTAPPVSRQDVPPATARHSFGGFENPLDMRMGHMPPRTSNVDNFSRSDPPLPEKPQLIYKPPAESTYEPLPQPPSFNFPKSGELEKSEDERSDSGLVIDTEKYDPTEPTHDDDSGDDHKRLPEPSTASVPKLAEIPVSGLVVNTLPSLPPQPAPPRTVESILAGIDTSNMNVSPNVLDSAVRQVLQEHRNLIASPAHTQHDDKSDEDSDGDCPNFSIYSATSVHIANNTSCLVDDIEQTIPQHDSMEDLVQEDDDIPTPVATSLIKPDNESPTQEQLNKSDTTLSVIKSSLSNIESSAMSKTEEEYKEKVSKRCPITTNTRNPIKIKLNTPSLIKRVSLYDEEDTSQDIIDKGETVSEVKLDPVKSVSPKLRKEQDKLSLEEMHTEKRFSGGTVNISKVKTNSENKDIPSEQIRIPVERKNNEELEKNKEANMDFHNENDFDAPSEDKSNDSDHGNTEISDSEICLGSKSAKEDDNRDRDEEENIEKMTESISETEDERSYTPCLDENKPKDASFETDKDKALEGLDTEMISEEEGNEMFSETERPPSVRSDTSPPQSRPVELLERNVVEKKKIEKKKSVAREDSKKKKKKESKKEGKDKNKGKKKGEIAFKKLSKNGKERNYRERDKDDKKKKERRSSSEPPESKKRRKEKRKDLERYDVRTLVSEKRRKVKDPFGRDVSPRARTASVSPARSVAARVSPSVEPKSNTRRRRSLSRARRSLSRARRSISRARRTMSRGHVSPHRNRRTPSRPRRSPFRRSISGLTPVGIRESPRRRSPVRIGRSPPPRRIRRSPSARSLTPRNSPRRSPSPRRRSPPRKRRRRSGSRPRRRRSASASPRRANKKKKRTRSERSPSRRIEKSPHRKARSRSLELSPNRQDPSPSIDSQLLSPRTPPPEPQDDVSLHLPPDDGARRRRRDPDRQRRRLRDVPGPSKEVFTSGDNILVSVSFKDQERGEETERRRRRENKRDRRRRRRTNPPPEAETAKPVAIIDLERSPFRELTPSPKNVIVLSDSEPGDRDAAEQSAPAPGPSPPPAEVPFLSAGPKTPPEPSGSEQNGPPVNAVASNVAPASGERSPSGAPQAEPQSPDAYDPFEPTRSASASPTSNPSQASPGAPPTPPRTMITLEAAQRTNMSADEVLDRRPLSPAEKVLALLQSTRDASPEPPPGDVGEGATGAPVPAAPRIVLPSPTRAPAKLFPGKPSPIKSNPVKPMQAMRPPSDAGASPYSPGSSDFGDLFEPRDSFEAVLRARRNKTSSAKVPVKLNKKKGKTQVGVKIDDDNLKILDELPSSAVEMQVKSKFLKKLNRQERVVEEVKLVLKPHYNKKHVTKDEYKHILRRAVPKICHNKTGEINPAKIQSLVEAYVKKFRKRRKLGLA